MASDTHTIVYLRDLLSMAVDRGDHDAATAIATAMAFGWSAISGRAPLADLEHDRVRVYNLPRAIVFKGTFREFLDMLANDIAREHARIDGRERN